MSSPFSRDYRFNHYGSYLKSRFGFPLFKIMVDGGFTCPNRDGTKGFGGCIYCNNDAFSAGVVGKGLSIKDQVEGSLKAKEGKKRYRNARFLVYFQSYTNTYGEVSHLKKVYREALVSDRIAGLVIGTRPDCIDRNVASLLKDLSGETYIAVELGVQSLSDEVLTLVNRGHGIDHFSKAAKILREEGIETGVHLIYGLPGDSKSNFLSAARLLGKEGVSLVKLNHIRVVRNTALAQIWKKGEFSPPSYDDYFQSVCDFIELLSPDITLARLISTTPEKYLLAPKWNVGSGRFIEEVNGELEKRGTYQGSAWEGKG